MGRKYFEVVFLWEIYFEWLFLNIFKIKVYKISVEFTGGYKKSNELPKGFDAIVKSFLWKIQDNLQKLPLHWVLP